jgi:hypothetical protein
MALYCRLTKHAGGRPVSLNDFKNNNNGAFNVTAPRITLESTA